MKNRAPEDSIAVLPFRNLSTDVENEYFSDGVTEEIINALTRVEGLNVIARSSAFAFKGQEADPREVGGKLNVAYILEGSVRKYGNKVRVTAQLVKTWDGFNVFSEIYDQELKDIFQVQDHISNKIVQRFTENVGLPATGKKLVPTSTENMEAYELYLKGRYNFSKGSLEDTHTAIRYFEAAIRKDPHFVLPVAGLAACYTFLGGSGMMEVNSAFEKAKDHASKAIHMDDRVSESHLALAKSSFWCDWDFEHTGSAIKKAIQLAPGTSDIHGFNSTYLMATGRLEEALIEAQLATKLDPLSQSSKFHLGELFYRSERYIEALEIFDAILAENPFFKQVSIFKAWSHLLLGDPESAIKIFEGIPITADEKSTFYGGLAYAYNKQMRYDKVLECMHNYRHEVENGNLHWLNYHYALIFRALREHEKMFTYLKKGLEERNTPLLFIQVDPVWKEFKSHPEFIKLVETSFLPEKKDNIVDLKSDTREVLRINLKKLLFVEAQENYSRFVWLEKDQVKDRLLRVTLKNVEAQIPDAGIVRCHRSYMINTAVRFSIRGNSNGYHLKSDLFPDTIPISRSLGKEIVARLREQGENN
ncbi:MAG: LytTR family transcriptional regulator DNA-binding domain-containing protein [Bacteroidales bacterium]